jgi:hypothetical protein
MKFICEDGSIYCYRETPTQEAKLIASFDEGLQSVPPHVEGRLNTQEQAELEQWLQEHNALHQSYAEKDLGDALLEALPKLLKHARRELNRRESIDPRLYQRLKLEAQSLIEALDSADKRRNEALNSFELIEQSTVLKTQLEMIKQKI